MPGPLSPGYAAQVPYNYNQLEGRFKQLQGKSVRVFWRCCHALILVNMLVQACSHCTKVLVREDRSGAVGRGILCGSSHSEGVPSLTQG